MGFCTQVCELQLGEECPDDPGIADDLCATGLICIDSTCQPLVNTDQIDYLNYLDYYVK